MANAYIDPVIEHYKQFVDREKLRENLKLTPEERLLRLEAAAALRTPRREPPGPDRPWDPVSDCGPNRTSDPIIELYKRDVDRSLLRENLKLTPEERLLKLMNFVHSLTEMQAAAKIATEQA